MNKAKTYFKIVLCLMFFALCFFGFQSKSVFAADEDNVKIFLSGTLKNAEGSSVGSENYNMRFLLYDQKTSNEFLWQEEFTGEEMMPVQNGKFQTILGTKNQLNIDLINKKYWLGVVVGGNNPNPSWDQEMTPRIPIVTLESIFLKGSVEISQEDFIKALIEEFRKSATSTENINQQAFLRFLQQRLTESDATAVIIVPETLNLLFDKILSFEENANVKNTGFWGILLNFFREVLDIISKSLTEISSRLASAALQATRIEDNTKEILSILKIDNSEETTQKENSNQIISQEKEKFEIEGVTNLGTNFLVGDFGEGVIAKGETGSRIYTNYLTLNAKVFITIKSPIPGVWWISDRRIGEYFEVSIIAPAEENILFDYWVVTPKEEILTVSSLLDSTSTESAESIEVENKTEEAAEENINFSPINLDTLPKKDLSTTTPTTEENIDINSTTSDNIISEPANNEN
ncbi:MAG: hypothetical protein WC242_00755 [Candidatus Paceibacterota bacterium]|jgi:hypothetical protein